MATTSPKSEIILHGWIQPCSKTSDVSNYRRVLEDVGVRVGPWDMFKQEFQDCAVTMSDFEQLEPLWGQYIWGLQ
jgi:hypothetical protein